MLAYRLYAGMSLMLLIGILMSEAEHAQPDVFDDGQKGQAMQEVRQYCGKSLSSALQLICAGVYNTRFKKSNEEMEMDDYTTYSDDPHPFKSVENANKMIRIRRNSQGIYEECCLKSCTIEELRSYCGAR